MCTIWIDQYGRYFDAMDRLYLTVPEMQYILGFSRPRYQLPMVIHA